jgi:DNA-binding transcriptional ArsR family regulator
MPIQEDEKKIVLDSSSFKALASETRVLMLKELGKKRSTASEIAKALGISVQAASEHLENLRIAGLVERADEGRKWIYFTLTEKGQAVLHPDKGKRLWVLLSLFVVIIASAGVLLMLQGNYFGLPASSQADFQQEQGLAAGSDQAVLPPSPFSESPPKLAAVITDNESNLNSTNSTG